MILLASLYGINTTDAKMQLHHELPLHFVIQMPYFFSKQNVLGSRLISAFNVVCHPPSSSLTYTSFHTGRPLHRCIKNDILTRHPTIKRVNVAALFSASISKP